MYRVSTSEAACRSRCTRSRSEVTVRDAPLTGSRMLGDPGNRTTRTQSPGITEAPKRQLWLWDYCQSRTRRLQLFLRSRGRVRPARCRPRLPARLRPAFPGIPARCRTGDHGRVRPAFPEVPARCRTRAPLGPGFPPECAVWSNPYKPNGAGSLY